MNKVLILSILAVLGRPTAVSAYGYGNDENVRYYDQYGMPTGSSRQSGNSIRFYDQYGMPTGTAHQNGNQINYYDQYGMPVGSARSR